MIVVPVKISPFGVSVVKSEGQWVSYEEGEATHKRHLIYPDTIETVDNERVHNAILDSEGTSEDAD